MKHVPELKDHYVINSGVFYLMGIMVMVPFQFYINSLDFWMYKFQSPRPRPRPPRPPLKEFKSTNPITNNYFEEVFYNISDSLLIKNSGYLDFKNSTRLSSYSWITSESNTGSDSTDTEPNERSPLQVNFTSSFNISSKVALLGALLICVMWSKKLPPPEKRLKWSLSALSVMFALNTLGTQINSKKMVEWFFAGTLILATLLNFCAGMANASLYELVSKFPPSHYASIQSGQNICGIISSALQVGLLSVQVRPNVNIGIYFVCGTIILIVTSIYYCYKINNSKYFIYKISQCEKERRISKVAYSTQTAETPRAELLFKIKWYYATLILAEGTTHLVYPGLAVLVVPYHRERRDLWKCVYFVPVITFLGFQVCNLIGREAARIIKKPKHGIVLFTIAALRIIMVPLLIFCNALPRRHLPVLFQDKEFICFVALLAFSEGILVNMAIVAIPTIIDKNDREAVMVLVPLAIAVTVTLTSGLNFFITNLI